METTKKQMKMLEVAFNSKEVKEMKTDEYNDYLQMLLTLSLSTVIATKGSIFAAEFVQAGLNSKEDQVVVQQLKQH